MYPQNIWDNLYLLRIVFVAKTLGILGMWPGVLPKAYLGYAGLVFLERGV